MSLEDAAELYGSDAMMEDSPAGQADLLLRCLTTQDRLLLQRQAELAAAERSGAPHSSGSSSGDGDGAANPSSSSRNSSGSGGGVAAGASKGLRFREEVERLISSATSAVLAHAQPPPHGLGALEASGLFGTGSSGARAAGSPPHSSVGGEEGEGEEPGESSGDKSHLAVHTVTQLMGVFKGSPIFRGGPVPGVQVLHQRWVDGWVGWRLVGCCWACCCAAECGAALLSVVLCFYAAGSSLWLTLGKLA